MCRSQGSAGKKAATLAAGSAVVSYSSIFYFTAYDGVFEHITTAYNRLLSELAPFIMAYVRLREAPQGMQQPQEQQQPVRPRFERKRLVPYVIAALVRILVASWFPYRWLSSGRGQARILRDFDKNGEPDLLWQNDTTRAVTVNFYSKAKDPAIQGWKWWLNSAGVPGWHLVAAADFDGNGVPDLVWQEDATHRVTVHYYGGERGSVQQGWRFLDRAENPGWTVVAAADFDRNGVPDLIWQNDITRQITVHYYGGPQGAIQQGWAWLDSVGSPGWRVVAAADFDENGVPDLVYVRDSTRQVVVHFYGGPRGALWRNWKWLNASGVPGWTPIVPR